MNEAAGTPRYRQWQWGRARAAARAAADDGVPRRAAPVGIVAAASLLGGVGALLSLPSLPGLAVLAMLLPGGLVVWARRGALAQQLNAIESLASVDVLGAQLDDAWAAVRAVGATGHRSLARTAGPPRPAAPRTPPPTRTGTTACLRTTWMPPRLPMRKATSPSAAGAPHE